jgi:hypothetical protein
MQQIDLQLTRCIYKGASTTKLGKNINPIQSLQELCLLDLNIKHQGRRATRRSLKRSPNALRTSICTNKMNVSDGFQLPRGTQRSPYNTDSSTQMQRAHTAIFMTRSVVALGPLEVPGHCR